MLPGQASYIATTIVVMLGLLTVGCPTVGARAQDGASRTLTIYAAECPAGYAGDASADQCDANPITGAPFRVGRPYTEAFYEDVPTDANGLVTFEIAGLPLDGTLRIIETLPAGAERFVTYCVDSSGVPLPISYPADVGNPALGVADVAVGDVGDVACDWYNVPETSRSTTVAVEQETNDVRMVEQPSWWVVPFAPGYGNTNEGHLYFGVLVENRTNATVNAGVSFRAYRDDGTPFPGCSGPVGDGSGVSTTIAPGETAFITCTRSVSPRTLTGLQVTARLWDVQPLPSRSATFLVVDTNFAAVPEQSSPMETSYDAAALVRPIDNHDTDVTLLFRFYDDQGVQVGTCDSTTATVEPEVAQKVSCSFPLTVDTTSAQPVRVRIEPSPFLR